MWYRVNPSTRYTSPEDVPCFFPIDHSVYGGEASHLKGGNLAFLSECVGMISIVMLYFSKCGNKFYQVAKYQTVRPLTWVMEKKNGISPLPNNYLNAIKSPILARRNAKKGAPPHGYA